MAKLAKNIYTTAKGERKLNCYVCNIPKQIIAQTNIKDDDEIMIYAKENRIIIEKSNSVPGGSIIKKEELQKMIEENGRQYVVTMYVNRKFNMTQKQLDYVLDYKGELNEE